MSERTKPYSAQELAHEAGVSDAYIRRLLIDGKLAGQKLGPIWMISAEEGRRFLTQKKARWQKY